MTYILIDKGVGKMEKSRLKDNQKGFSMIEIIITITLMGIIGAALAPSFMSITRKTKLKADIQSVQTFQNMIDIYTADHDGKLPGNGSGKDTESDGLQGGKEVGAETYKALVASGYIDKKDLVGEQETINLQTEDASLNYDGTKEQVVLYIDYSKNQKMKDMVRDLNDREEQWVILPKTESDKKE